MLWAVTLGPVVFDQKMDVVRRHHIIENRETEAFLGLKNPMQVTAAVARKLQ